MENLDNRINWVGFYSGYLNNPKPCGSNKMHACCPFHEEKHPSLTPKTDCLNVKGVAKVAMRQYFYQK